MIKASFGLPKPAGPALSSLWKYAECFPLGGPFQPAVNGCGATLRAAWWQRRHLEAASNRLKEWARQWHLRASSLRLGALEPAGHQPVERWVIASSSSHRIGDDGARPGDPQTGSLVVICHQHYRSAVWNVVLSKQHGGRGDAGDHALAVVR